MAIDTGAEITEEPKTTPEVPATVFPTESHTIPQSDKPRLSQDSNWPKASDGTPQTVIARPTPKVQSFSKPETSIPTDKKVQAGILAGLVAAATALFRGHSNAPANPNLMQPPQPNSHPDQAGVTSPGAANVDLTSGVITPSVNNTSLKGEVAPYPSNSWNTLKENPVSQQNQSNAEAQKAMGANPQEIKEP